MTLDHQTMALIAVGASITANCQPCLEINIATALRCGADSHQIADAVEVGRRVRRGAASKMDTFASTLDGALTPSTGVPESACGCGSADKVQVKNG